MLVALAACALVHDHTRLDSASPDEPVHILAAWEQISAHNGSANIEHPPLSKDVAGLGLLFVRGVHDIPRRPQDSLAYLGHAFLFFNGAPPDTILAAARAPMLIFFFALMLLAFGAARRFFGAGAGFFALLLVAFSPNFLAHAGIVHTDVPEALFWLASVLAWGNLLRRRHWIRVLAAGVLLGLALATKFSALFLFPTLALVSLGARLIESREFARPGRWETFGRRFGADLVCLAAAGVVALATTLAVYVPSVSGISAAAQRNDILMMVGRGQPDYRLASDIAAVSSWSRPLAQFLGGVASVWRHNELGIGLNFLNGRVSRRGVPSYFFICFLVKSTLPFLISTLLMFAVFFRRRLDRLDALLLLPVAYYFFFSLSTTYNIGVRHILPIYPLLAIAASRLVPRARSLGRPIARRCATAGLVLLSVAQVATAASSHPHELSYFNALAGGPKGGIRILCDSNLDWGLDLRRLAIYLREHHIQRPTVAYFGGDATGYRTGVPDFVALPILRGRFVAISATILDEGPAYYTFYGRPDLAQKVAALIALVRTRGKLVGRVGGSIYLFELPAPVPASG